MIALSSSLFNPLEPANDGTLSPRCTPNGKHFHGVFTLPYIYFSLRNFTVGEIMRKKFTFNLDEKTVEETRAVFPEMPLSRIVERALKKALETGRSWLL